MLYLLDVETDYARMEGRVAQPRAAKHARVIDLIGRGMVVVERLKASGHRGEAGRCHLLARGAARLRGLCTDAAQPFRHLSDYPSAGLRDRR